MATPRQARLVDWMKRPTDLPDHPAVRVENAMWTAAEIVDGVRLYQSRRACLDDLKALERAGVVERWGNRWRYVRAGELR